MSPDDPAAHREFGAGYWEDRYRSGEPTSRQEPSPSIVMETSTLPPGHALDAGCGRGADAIWLAARGWHVTAVDVSAAALEQAHEAADAAGRDVAERIQWVRADLTEWAPGDQRFDLVTSHYVHVPGPAERLFGRLASWVAPAGTLLVVGHDHGPAGESAELGHSHGGHHGHERGRGEQPHGVSTADHGPPPHSWVRTEQITAGLPDDHWDVVVAESRTHTVRRPDGSGTVALRDVVVRARRHGLAQP